MEKKEQEIKLMKQEMIIKDEHARKEIESKEKEIMQS